MVVHPGVDHAFFNDTRPEVYDAEQAGAAWEDAALAFFAESSPQPETAAAAGARASFLRDPAFPQDAGSRKNGPAGPTARPEQQPRVRPLGCARVRPHP